MTPPNPAPAPSPSCSLPPDCTQLLFGAIIIPYACLLVGVVQQATSPKYAAERQAVYASALLLALMTVYTACVLACLWIFHRVQAQESEESRAHEVSWQPQDMMFFMVRFRFRV
jgi:hypothetical protein